jgi:hypothetical protein
MEIINEDRYNRYQIDALECINNLVNKSIRVNRMYDGSLLVREIRGKKISLVIDPKGRLEKA